MRTINLFLLLGVLSFSLNSFSENDDSSQSPSEKIYSYRDYLEEHPDSSPKKSYSYLEYIKEEHPPEPEPAPQINYFKLNIIQLIALGNKGDAGAQYRLGLKFRAENLHDIAEEWLTKAAEQGHEGAKQELESPSHFGDHVSKVERRVRGSQIAIGTLGGIIFLDRFLDSD